MPPSTFHAWPVTKLESSDARYTARGDTSSGWPCGPIGVAELIFCSSETVRRPEGSITDSYGQGQRGGGAGLTAGVVGVELLPRQLHPALDRARTDNVGRDAVLGVLLRDRAGQAVHRGLGGAVADAEGCRELAGDGAHGDDAAPLLRDHVGQRRLGEQVRRVHVHVELQVPEVCARRQRGEISA